MLTNTVIVALISAFFVLLTGKIGMRDYLIEACKVPILSKLFACDFCYCFWLNVLLCAGLAFAYSDYTMLVIPILATPITRYLI